MTEAEKNKKISDLELVIKNNENKPEMAKMVAKAKERLSEIKGLENPQEPVKSDAPCSEEIANALKLIEDALRLMEQNPKSGGISAEEFEEMFKNSKVNRPQLGEDVIAFIQKNQKITLEPLPNVEVQLDGTYPEIFWLVKSDLEANNNVYLYGGAGTGKTYTVGELATALNCSLITINCNQYTSPLEIIGGQTIDGYQQGKLITAWANLTKASEGVTEGMSEGTTGVILLLDELPKIDPNTAGLLNDALAKIKEVGKKSVVQDARGTRYEKKRFYCVATGNSKLNEESADYVANFKQDLSLQDRFAGSTYELFVNLETERKLMDGYLFIFNYMNKIRSIIESNEGKTKQLSSKGFVSIRIMQSLRDTFRYWYENHQKGITIKTLQQGIISFFELFTASQQEFLKTESDWKAFQKEIAEQEKLPLAYDTDESKAKAQVLVDEYLAKSERRNKGL